MSQVAVARGGYASGVRLGAGIAFAYRSTTWPYKTSSGIDALQVDIFANVDHRGMGARVSPFNLVFSLWSDSVFQGGYLRWNLIDIGGAARPGGPSSIEVGSALAFGYSLELSEGVAIRVGEIGVFAGVFAKDDHNDLKPLFDGGVTLTTGITFR